MLLRRLTGQVANQNWFAVGVDFYSGRDGS